MSLLDLEVILVNDGSADETKRVALELVTLFKNLNIKFIDLPRNLGLLYARFAGFQNSTKQYIMFLDADDELIEYRLI